MPALLNVFSWSKSRDEQFRECARKYYYDKYLSWGGWDASAKPNVRMAYILKNIKNRWAWKGERVHHVIEDVLKNMRAGQSVPLETSLARLTDILRADYRNSKAKRYYQEPKKTMGLFEHEYEKNVPDETWKKMHDESVECLKNFYASDFFKELEAEDKKNWLVIEDLEEYDFSGSKIFVKLDFARRKGDTIEIYDWKTGKEENEEASVQIGTYAMYAMGKWGVPLSSVKAFLFHLSSSSPKPKMQTVDQALLDRTRAFMAESIGLMKTLLEDPANNKPFPEDRFPFTENPRFCQNCNFLKICLKHRN